MTEEEIKEALNEAANNGCKKRFNELAEQLEETTENILMISFYSRILFNHPKVRYNAYC